MHEAEYPLPLPGAKAPTLMWATPWEVEPAAANQLRNISALPWVEGVRVMPDVHLGKGATVGSVVAMRGAVAPSAVGVDIGCGMAAVPTGVAVDALPDDLHRLRLAIESAVPVGFAAHDGSASPIHNRRSVLSARADRLFGKFDRLHVDVSDRYGKAVAQCGTLGGGNHFIEVTHDETGQVWLMLHSGSRNIGKEIAERHTVIAKTLEHNAGLPDPDLAVFLRGTPLFEHYVYDLFWAQDYAALNRAVMLALVQSVFRTFVPQARYGDTVQCHHNYVAKEAFGGVDLMVTRKGAISAQYGELGLIPGSMGTGSYVVRGLGNEVAYCSASHGAGRRMSRGAAKRTFTLEDLAVQTEGVECRKDAGVLDEIPGAYKDLGAVIAAQTEGPSPLVEVVHRLTTLLCVKG